MGRDKFKERQACHLAEVNGAMVDHYRDNSGIITGNKYKCPSQMSHISYNNLGIIIRKEYECPSQMSLTSYLHLPPGLR